MSKFPFVFAVLLLIGGAALHASNKYWDELNALKTQENYRIMFDDEIDGLSGVMLRDVSADIENTLAGLSWWQNFCRCLLLADFTVVVTQKNMPQLHGLVESMCAKTGMKAPVVFITLEKKGFFNAFASKIIAGSGIVVIGQELLKKTTTEEVEAVVAHELGHVKYNHVNKTLLASITALISYITIARMVYTYERDYFKPTLGALAGFSLLGGSQLLIGKRFEWEADDFACKNMDKAQGVKSFFEKLKKRGEKSDNNFAEVSSYLGTHGGKLSFFSYAGLCWNYTVAKTIHKLGKARKWLYHNTPWGPHPSPQARIDNAQKYIAA